MKFNHSTELQLTWSSDFPGFYKDPLVNKEDYVLYFIPPFQNGYVLPNNKVLQTKSASYQRVNMYTLRYHDSAWTIYKTSVPVEALRKRIAPETDSARNRVLEEARRRHKDSWESSLGLSSLAKMDSVLLPENKDNKNGELFVNGYGIPGPEDCWFAAVDSPSNLLKRGALNRYLSAAALCCLEIEMRR